MNEYHSSWSSGIMCQYRQQWEMWIAPVADCLADLQVEWTIVHWGVVHPNVCLASPGCLWPTEASIVHLCGLKGGSTMIFWHIFPLQIDPLTNIPLQIDPLTHIPLQIDPLTHIPLQVDPLTNIPLQVDPLTHISVQIDLLVLFPPYTLM